MLAMVNAGRMWAYAVTSRFIQKNWSLAPAAVVMLVACGAMSTEKTGNDDQLFRDVVASKAGLVVGWTGEAYGEVAYGVARLTFDRMLGTNQFAAWRPVQTPKERPWDWNEILKEIQAQGKTTNPPDQNDIWPSVLAASGSDAILTPSIATIDVEENKKQFILHGSFGASARDKKVTLSQSAADNDQGTELGGCQWQPDTVTCTVDGQQAGYVRAVADGRRSNPVAVTRFKPVLKWHLHGGTGKGGIIDWVSEMRPILRVDVQSYRRHLLDDPKARDPFRVDPSLDSKCTFKSTGYGVGPHGEKIPIKGDKTGDIVGPYDSVVASSSPFGSGMGAGAQMGALAGLPQVQGLSGIGGAAGALGAMPDLGAQKSAPVGKCLLGGTLDPTQGTRFAASVALADDLIVPDAPALRGGFDVRMLIHKGSAQDLIKQITLNMQIVVDAQSADVEFLKGHLESKNKDAEITLDWDDTKGEFPPDPTSAR
jgi:hypothetical protein